VTTRHGSDAFALGRHELWSLREDVHVELAPDGGPALLRSRWGDVTVQRPSSLIREALHRMRLGPISLENIVEDPARPAATPGRQERAGAGDAITAPEHVQWTRLYGVLERLQPLVIRSLGLDDGQPFLSVVPLTPNSRFRPVLLAPDVPVRLSSFATLRTDGNEYLLESPLSLHRVHLHRPEAIWLVGALGRAITPAASAASLPHGDPIADDALAYLAAAGMVIVAEGAQTTPGRPPVFAEDDEQALAGWSAADLTFHTRSTLGRHDHDVGATYPRGEFRPTEPVVKPRPAEPGIPLYRPAWEDLVAADPPLTVAIEGRRSTRSYGAAPMTAAELGELLYRTARVRSLGPAAAGTAGNDDPMPDLSDRPYPAGGACYELELYVTVGQCAGIATGVYHYDPLRHRLEPVNADRATAHRLLSHARAAANADGPPQVLITLTARLPRLTWKYEGLTYALMLKHVGVLTQMLYLVATAMHLAACALGSVNIDATAHAFGTDWRTEPSVGQFMIGSAPGTAEDHRDGWLSANDASWPGRARTESAQQHRTWR
jgi:SagB-type dehydrogenase family enzyme